MNNTEGSAVSAFFSGGFRTAAVSIVLVLLVLSSCESPFSPPHPSGAAPRGETGIRIPAGAGGIGALTLFPAIDAGLVTRLRVSLTNGPDGAPVPPMQDVPSVNGIPSEELIFSNVVPGYWDVRVDGMGVDPGNATGGVTAILYGEATRVPVQPGRLTTISVPLSARWTGQGTLSVRLEWPAVQPVAGVDVRLVYLGAGGSATATVAQVDGAEWTPVAIDSITNDGTTAETTIERSDLTAGVYFFSVRLDAGPGTPSRYRAFVDEIAYVFGGMTTAASISLRERDFSMPNRPESEWERLVREGRAVANPDGSYTFTQTGWRKAQGGNEIVIDPVTFGIDLSGISERRLFAEMPDSARYRLEIHGARMIAPGRGWGVFFHGLSSGGSANYAGYSLQFDPGLGMQNEIVVRQWQGNRERAPFIRVPYSDHGIDLYQPLDVRMEVNGPALTVWVRQSPVNTPPHEWNRIIDETDITSLDGLTGSPRTDGFIGLRAWGSTAITVDSLRILPRD